MEPDHPDHDRDGDDATLVGDNDDTASVPGSYASISGMVSCCNCMQHTALQDSIVLVRAKGKSTESYRCKACHRVKSRLNRLFARRPDLLENWEDVSCMLNAGTCAANVYALF